VAYLCELTYFCNINIATLQLRLTDGESGGKTLLNFTVNYGYTDLMLFTNVINKTT
jgi:hypothetical protein